VRFIIYGAGGIGGTIGARLHLAGYEVVLIARGEHGIVLQQQGLEFIAPDTRGRLQMRCCLTPADVDWQTHDVIVLCMKSQHTAAALDDLRAAGAGHLPVVCAQNGVANEAMALRRMPLVYGMLVVLPALFLQPGQVITNTADSAGWLDTGVYPTGVDDRVHEFTQALTHAGFSSAPDPAVMRKKYAKLLSNLFNALSALTGMADGSQPIGDRLRQEALACYAAAGIEAASSAEMKAGMGQLTMTDLPEFSNRAGSSWQSLERGTGNIEVDFLNGEIAELGRRYGIATPANIACQNLALELSRRSAHTQIHPGSVSVAQVNAEIEQLNRTTE